MHYFSWNPILLRRVSAYPYPHTPSNPQIIKLIMHPTPSKTTGLRDEAGTTMFFKTGDVEFPDQSKGNIYNNVQPIKDFIMRQAVERLHADGMSGVVVMPADAPGGVASTIRVGGHGATPTTAASAVSAVSNSVPAPSKTTGSTEASAAPSSSSADVKQSAAGDDEDSAAGRKAIDGSLLAAAVAIAAVIIA